MKTLVLVFALSLLPVAASAQDAKLEDQCLGSMGRFNDQILLKAKAQFEDAIQKSLKLKYRAVPTFKISKISEVLRIEKQSHTYDADESGGQKTDNYYLLTISNIQIETARGNIFTLNVPAVVIRGEEPQLEKRYDDEKVFVGVACTASFTTGFSDLYIINKVTQQNVTPLAGQSLSVSPFFMVSTK